MNKYIIWGVNHKNLIIALSEDLSCYAQGETFWKALLSLMETNKTLTPSHSTGETDINARLKMYYDTGVNKIELFISLEGDKFAVKCSNSRSFIKVKNEQEALFKYIEERARTSNVNSGDILK